VRTGLCLSVGVTSGQVSIFATLVSCSVFRVVDLWLFVSPRFGEGCPVEVVFSLRHWIKSLSFFSSSRRVFMVVFCHVRKVFGEILVTEKESS
jgi:hypothetical protein